MLAKLDLPDQQTLVAWRGEPARDPEAAAPRRFLGIAGVPLGWLASRLARPVASGVIVVGSAGVIAVAVGAGVAILDNLDEVDAPGDTRLPSTNPRPMCRGQARPRRRRS